MQRRIFPTITRYFTYQHAYHVLPYVRQYFNFEEIHKNLQLKVYLIKLEQHKDRNSTGNDDAFVQRELIDEN